MVNAIRYISFRQRWFWGVFLIVLSATIFQAMAQTVEEDRWRPPINLSQSGIATDPVLLVDADEGLHLLWQDPIAGFIYSHNLTETGVWRDPIAVAMPFSEPAFFQPSDDDFEQLYSPALFADANRDVHGLWRNEDGLLLYSRTRLDDLSTSTGWTSRQILDDAVLTFDATMDDDGRFHVSYIRWETTPEMLAGIYYIQSGPGTSVWSEPMLLYPSNYLRALPSDQINLKIIVGDEQAVYVTWDNRPLETVFFTRSVDGGVTWDTAVPIDQRVEDDDPEGDGPRNITLTVAEGRIHLTWTASHEEGICSQYHQWSDDAGQTWQPREVIFSELDCSTTNRFIVGRDGLLFLATTNTLSEAFFQAWDGEQWGERVLQQPLATVTVPETFRNLELGCLQTYVTADNRLVLVGCSLGVIADIWIQERPLGDLSDWSGRFAPTPVWSQPSLVANTDFGITSPILFTDRNGQFHALWIGTEATTNTLDNRTIFYTYWDGVAWSRRVPVVNGPADQLAVALSADEELLMVWVDPIKSILLFSQVDLERAIFPADWSPAQPLLTTQTAVRSPQVFLGSENRPMITYVSPLNEQRGVYLIQLQEDDSWSEPITVFDGVAANWDNVERPRLTQTNDGTLHMLWSQYSLPNGPGPLGLYYARSEDDGQSWSEPELVDTEGVVWSELVALGDKALIRLWQQIEGDQARFEYQLSFDSGVQWEQASPILGFADLSGPVQLIVDVSKQLHLIQIVEGDEERDYSLQAWRWQGGNWFVSDQFDLVTNASMNANNWATALNGRGELLLMYPDFVDEGRLDLLFISRFVELPEQQPTPQPTALPTIAPTPTATATSEPTPTPELSFPTLADDSSGVTLGPLDTGTPTGGLAVGIILAGIIIVIVFAIGLRTTWRRRR